MKQTLFFTILTAGLILNTSCGKKESDTPPAPAPDSLGTPPIPIPEAVATATTEIRESVQSYTVKAEDILNELSDPVAAVKEKVASYSQPELQARVEQYKQIILDQKNQLSELTDQLKELPMTELFSEQGKALQNQVAQYTEQLTALRERYSIYIEKLNNMGITLGL